MRLDGKVAIVTGGGQGIGRAIALAFAAEGADIVVADINIQTARGVAGEVKATGRRALAVRADVTRSPDVNRMAARALDRFHRIDILVNCAGVDKFIPTLEQPEAQWDRMIDINLKSQFLCSRAAARQMMAQGGGKIINMASVAGYAAMPARAAYSASKAGVLQLTRVLAVEWAQHNIKVNAVCPGATLTAMVEQNAAENPRLFQALTGRIPLKRMAKTEDVAQAALFLAAPESDYITGQSIVVDGGLSALHPGFTGTDK